MRERTFLGIVRPQSTAAVFHRFAVDALYGGSALLSTGPLHHPPERPTAEEKPGEHRPDWCGHVFAERPEVQRDPCGFGELREGIAHAGPVGPIQGAEPENRSLLKISESPRTGHQTDSLSPSL